MFGDNRSVVTRATLPHSTLIKRHNILAFHRVREAIAQQDLPNDSKALHHMWPYHTNPKSCNRRNLQATQIKRKKSNAMLHPSMCKHALSSVACYPQSHMPTLLDSLVSDVLLAIREGQDNYVPLTSCFLVDCCIGFGNQVHRDSICEEAGFESLEDFVRLSEKDIREMADGYEKHTQAQGHIPFGL